MDIPKNQRPHSGALFIVKAFCLIFFIGFAALLIGMIVQGIGGFFH